MSLDIMFLTNDNLRRMRREPQILGLRYRGLVNGTNDSDQAHRTDGLNGDVPHKRTSNTSTASNVSLYHSDSATNSEFGITPRDSLSSVGGHWGSDHNHGVSDEVDNSHRDEQDGFESTIYERNQHANVISSYNGNLNQFGRTSPNGKQQQFGTQPRKNSNEIAISNGVQQTTNTPKSQPYQQRGYQDPGLVPNGIRKAPEGQDNDSFIHEDDIDSKKEGMTINGNQVALNGGDSATHYATDKDGKINVHVTVLINAGTLADLKKQRSQIRTTSVDHSITGNTSGSQSSESPVPVVGNTVPSTPTLSLSASPLTANVTVPRFTGNTGDVVGDARSNRCCVVM